MMMNETHKNEVLFLEVLSKATDYNMLVAINEDDITPYLQRDVEVKEAPESIFRMLLHRLSELIIKNRPIELINKYSENLLQLLYLTDSNNGFIMPNTTNLLCRVIDVYDFFLSFGSFCVKNGDVMVQDDYVFRVNLVRLIDAAMPVDKYTRMVYSYLLRTPH